MFCQVKMGSNIAHQAGTLNYLEFWETTYFIGIMCGVGALILLIIVIIILCRCRRRRNMKRSKRQSQIQLTQKTSAGSGAAENQYSERKSLLLFFTSFMWLFVLALQAHLILFHLPEGRLGISDISPLSGILGLSFESTLLSLLLFSAYSCLSFCLVFFFLPTCPFS